MSDLFSLALRLAAPSQCEIDEADRRAARFRQLLSRIDLRGFPLRLGLSVVRDFTRTRVGIAVSIYTSSIPGGECITLDNVNEPSGSETDAEIADKVLKTASELLEHELREQFTLDGKRIFDPHAPQTTTSFNGFVKV